jgi:hypothetical protein
VAQRAAASFDSRLVDQVRQHELEALVELVECSLVLDKPAGKTALQLDVCLEQRVAGRCGDRSTACREAEEVRPAVGRV